MFRLLAVLVFAGTSLIAQTITTQSFGTGTNTFSIDFVEIGNPGNSADTTGSPNPVGRVDYIYNLGKYEISRDQIDKANAAGGLGITVSDMTSYGGNGVNRPATGISWLEAAKFVNYLNNSQGKQAAYNFDESGNFQLWAPGQYSGTNQYRHKNTYYFLPSVDEWYKGAFGSSSGNWYDYSTASDIAPSPTGGGLEDNTAVYDQSGLSAPADIGNAGGLSAWGTMAQGGNAHEWIETAVDGVNDDVNENRESRGGWWNYAFSISSSSSRFTTLTTTESDVLGLRVASVPEPSSFSLLLAGGTLLLGTRKRLKI